METALTPGFGSMGSTTGTTYARTAAFTSASTSGFDGLAPATSAGWATGSFTGAGSISVRDAGETTRFAWVDMAPSIVGRGR